MVGPGDPQLEMAGNRAADHDQLEMAGNRAADHDSHPHIVFESETLFVRMKRKTRKGNHFISLASDVLRSKALLCTCLS